MKRKRQFENPFFSSSPEETKKYASEFASLIKPPFVLYLEGDVGAGKTTFTKFYAENYRIDGITSSTFERVTLHKGLISVVHCDFYRKQPDSSFFYEEIEHLLCGDWVMILEWARNFKIDHSCAKYILEIEQRGISNRLFYLKHL